MTQRSGHQRLLAAIDHEEPDRVPVAPCVQTWLTAKYGDATLATQLRELPQIDPMHIVADGTVNYLETYPSDYDLPGVEVTQRRYGKDEFEVVERTFLTPAGKLADRPLIPPSGREYGVSPNRVKAEHLIKTASDLQRLPYLLPLVLHLPTCGLVAGDRQPRGWIHHRQFRRFSRGHATGECRCIF